jgi:hypothetical protein
MSESKTEIAEDPVCNMSLNEVRELLHELECLGFVKRTGEFQNGNPVDVSTLTRNGTTEEGYRKED